MLANHLSGAYNASVLDTNRPIPPRVTDADLKAVLDHLNQSFERTRVGLHCPTHGTNPRVEFAANHEEGIFYEALVCCPDLDDLVFTQVRRHLIEHPVGDWRFGGE